MYRTQNQSPITQVVLADRVLIGWGSAEKSEYSVGPLHSFGIPYGYVVITGQGVESPYVVLQLLLGQSVPIGVLVVTE